MGKDRFEAGMRMRRAVLGDEHVERSLQKATDFSRPMQELVTEYCWGEIWNREGLDRKTRSIINLAMLAALNRPHELELHVKGAITNGVSVDEIQEILLQVAIYCGVPAGIDGFRVAQKAINSFEG